MLYKNNRDCIAEVDGLTILVKGEYGKKYYRFNSQSEVDYFISHNFFKEVDTDGTTN